MKVYINCRSGQVVVALKPRLLHITERLMGGWWWWGFLIDVFMTAKCSNATGKTYYFYIHMYEVLRQKMNAPCRLCTQRNFFGVINFMKYIYTTAVC